MADANLHEVNFQWPHTHPTTVIVTGTFDGWAKTLHLKKTSTGFEGSAKIPWDQTIKYKFIVDGQWLVNRRLPIDVERGSGFVNNVYTAPARPAFVDTPAVLPPVSVNSNVDKANGPIEAAAKGEKESNGHAVHENGNGNSAAASDKAGDKSEQTKVSGSPRLPQLLSDLASTIVAGHGTNSAYQYVTSGFGAAVHSVVGVDPIALPTPKAEDKFDRPFETVTTPNSLEPQTMTTTTAASLTVSAQSNNSPPVSPVAPIVPIMIVPVNAPENCTIPSASPPTEEVVAAPVSVPEVDPPVSEIVNGDSEATKEVALKAEEPSTHAPIVSETGVEPIVSDLKTAESKPAEDTPVAVVAAESKGATTSPSPAKEESSTDKEVTPEPTPEPTSVINTDKAVVAEAVPAVGAEAPKPESKIEGPPTKINGEKKESEPTPIAAPAENSKPATSEAPKSPPATPNKAQVFPTSGNRSPTPTSPSKSPSRFSSIRSGAGSKRKSSILGKLKHIFVKDKDEKEVKEKK
ncbi:hypothetical protein CPB83DRAFT_879223 [Crepidotus variabilis]|uniref:AMP-activated protein kinase glycogen-binding domain-containing protein n=1 Tax=Crepidotus variabilis TaxID=179855 RepID=A0A9P6ETH4_9AGAR|nr:hypothetical protein CPB83DRAFT_879223 [Crepidotus variabilis]